MKNLFWGAVLGIVLLVTVAARPSVSPAILWAVVNLDGSLARGNGATSAYSLEVDGQYEVVFNRNVASCSFVASGGEATNLSPDDAVVFTVAPSQTNVNTVFVQEWDGILGRDSYSSGFHLIVAC